MRPASGGGAEGTASGVPRATSGPGDPAFAPILQKFQAMAMARWDLAAFDAEVRQSQARRWIIYEALRQGSFQPWDYQPHRPASDRYMRNHMDLNVLEDAQRFPRGE